MNELIRPHNIGVKNALENMKEVLALYKKVIGKTTISFGIHRYAKCSSLRNKGGTTRLSISGRVPTGGERCCILPRFA